MDGSSIYNNIRHNVLYTKSIVVRVDFQPKLYGLIIVVRID